MLRKKRASFPGMSLTENVSAGSFWSSATPISSFGRAPSLSPSERKFRRATDCRPAFRVMSLLRSLSTAYCIPPTAAPLPGPLAGAAVIAAFLLGSPDSSGEVMAERRREVPPSLACAIVKVQGLSLWGEKKPGYNIHRQSRPHAREVALTVRCYILALLPGVAARLAQRYKLHVGDRELRSASPTSIMIILVLLQFVNRCFILFSTFSIFQKPSSIFEVRHVSIQSLFSEGQCVY